MLNLRTMGRADVISNKCISADAIQTAGYIACSLDPIPFLQVFFTKTLTGPSGDWTTLIRLLELGDDVEVSIQRIDFEDHSPMRDQIHILGAL